MPSKKKKYDARFPAARIKKIMQSDDEIGKVAQAVPVIISKTLELFVESLLTKTLKITLSRNAKTLSTSHMKQCIMSEQRFDFLRELVKNIPDISVAEETASNNNEDDGQTTPEENYPDSDTPFDLSLPSTSTQASRNMSTKEMFNKRKHDQNGSGANNFNIPKTQVDEPNRAHLRHDSEIIQRLQQQVTTAASSSIHTINSAKDYTSSISDLSNSYLKPKLLRSDSSPNYPTNNSQHQLRHQLKHQSQSIPLNHTNINATKSQEAKPCTVVKQQKKDTINQLAPTALPAPIISYDFFNKPIVKIDYSNLQMPIVTTTSPLSAPALISDCNTAKDSAFNFKTEPIINIDLTNIVGTFNYPSVPKTNTTTIPPTILPKSIMAVPFKTNNLLNTTTNKNSIFELDEDYDNI